MKIILVLGTLIVLGTSFVSAETAVAQSELDDLLEGLPSLKDSTKELKTGAFSDWASQHVAGRLAGSTSSNTDGARRVYSIQLGAGERFGPLELVLKGSYSYQYVRFAEELVEEYRGDPEYEDFPEERITIVKQDVRTLEDAFVGLSLGPISLRGGVQTIVYGQFKGFSPVDIVLPFRSDAVSVD